jgi:DNA-binding transcriptional LysR family regulator
VFEFGEDLLDRIEVGAVGWQEEQMGSCGSSDLATVVAAMARDGRGVSWSPLSLVAEDIAAGRLARVENLPAEGPIPAEGATVANGRDLVGAGG